VSSLSLEPNVYLKNTEDQNVQSHNFQVIFQILTATSINMTVFRHVATYSQVESGLGFNDVIDQLLPGNIPEEVILIYEPSWYLWE
jgi:hypothetical protein